jgi:TRAP-type mannitol/chloroaromatic compound transport system substrate-binding protein
MRSMLVAGLTAVVLTTSASAQEVTLRAVSSFAEGTEFSKNFERFVEKVNADGKGLIKINYIGGPRAVPPFEVGNAVRTRVVDMANVTGAFYTNLMPEADGFKLNGKPMSEQRKNGTWEYINQLHNQSSIRNIWRGSSTTCRSTSTSTRKSTRPISPA